MFSKGCRTNVCFIVMAVMVSLSVSAACAQARAHNTPEVDLAVGYSTTRQTNVQGTPFWQKGGFAELSTDAWHGLGAAMLVTGQTATNLNGKGVDFNMVTVTVGPRYTYRRRRFAAFAEGLIGESNGFGGVYPAAGGAQTNATTFAVNANGGVDLLLQKHLSLRLLEAGWQYTQFSNATTNVQSVPTLGAGIVFRLQR